MPADSVSSHYLILFLSLSHYVIFFLYCTPTSPSQYSFSTLSLQVPTKILFNYDRKILPHCEISLDLLRHSYQYEVT
jgi:hypothetical protein